MVQSGASSPLSVLFILTGLFFLNFFSRIIFSPLLPVIEQDLSLSHASGGTFFLILSCGYFLSLAGSGYVSSRLSHKQTITASMLAIGVSLALIAAGSRLLHLQAALFVLGLAAGVYIPSGISTISALFAPHQWGRAFAIHELAPNLAFVTAPLYTSLLLTHLRWQQTLIILAAAAFLAAFLYSRHGRGEDLYGEPPNLANCAAILLSRNFLILVLLFSAGIAGTIGLFNVLPIFLVSVHSLSPGDANLLVGISRAASLGSALAGGWLADRFGNRRTLCGVLLLTGIATIGIGGAKGGVPVLWIFLQPILAVCFFPAGFALLSRIGTSETRNIVISLAMPLAFVAGGGLLPALVTRLADSGLFRAGLVIMGAIICLGSLLVFLLRSNEKSV